MRARLLLWHKARLQGRYILEMELYAIEKSESYPNGIRYRLIILDLWTQHRVLMDNHYTKGPHFHLDTVKYIYAFKDEETLVADFRRLAPEHLEVRL